MNESAEENNHELPRSFAASPSTGRAPRAPALRLGSRSIACPQDDAAGIQRSRALHLEFQGARAGAGLFTGLLGFVVLILVLLAALGGSNSLGSLANLGRDHPLEASAAGIVLAVIAAVATGILLWRESLWIAQDGSYERQRGFLPRLKHTAGTVQGVRLALRCYRGRDREQMSSFTVELELRDEPVVVLANTPMAQEALNRWLLWRRRMPFAQPKDETGIAPPS